MRGLTPLVATSCLRGQGCRLNEGEEANDARTRTGSMGANEGAWADCGEEDREEWVGNWSESDGGDGKMGMLADDGRRAGSSSELLDARRRTDRWGRVATLLLLRILYTLFKILMAGVRRKCPVQLELPLRSWGGRRKGAGRKPLGGRPPGWKAGMPHLRRPRLKARHPVHVTMSLRNGLPSLRYRSLAAVVLAAFRRATERGTHLVHFSVQSNHLHLIVEADGERALSRAMQGLAISVARRLNRKLRRRGAVFGDRYHCHVLRTPLEVRRALVYVLHNHRHHLGRDQPSGFDSLSTAPYFDGFVEWLDRLRGRPPPEAAPVVPPQTWLLRVGWRRHGLLTAQDVPS